MKRIIVMLAFAATASAQTAKNDYADGKSWLCRPGRQDACTVDQRATIVAADGTLTREEWSANPSAPIDCFYVYPTVSADPGGNSDMIAGAEETGVVRAQLARFASKCKVYAPLYRQATLTALRAATTAKPDRRRSRARLQRRPRLLEPLPATRQQRARCRTDRAIDTPFVSVPGLLTAQCVSNDNGSYLEVTVHGNPADPRADDTSAT